MPPTYEPPKCPLSAKSVDKLGTITGNRPRETELYRKHIKQALSGIADATYDIQAELREREKELQFLQKRRKQREAEKSEQEERLEMFVAELEEEVQDLTEQAEALVRSCIDQSFAHEDDAKIVSELYTTATATLQQQRNVADDPDEPLPAESLVNKVRDLREMKTADWETNSNFQRYAKSNEYINFKKLWRDGAVGDDGPVLPNANRWFKEDGTPVMIIKRGNKNDDDDDDEDSDEDVAIERETISLTCPLSLLPLKEPYTNKICGHTFEKQSIVEYLKGTGGELTCPTTGCDQKMSWARFNDDFALDQVILRRIQRANQEEDQEMAEDTDEDEQEQEQSVVVGRSRQRRVKNEQT